jgi:hypothetical protein
MVAHPFTLTIATRASANFIAQFLLRNFSCASRIVGMTLQQPPADCVPGPAEEPNAAPQPSKQATARCLGRAYPWWLASDTATALSTSLAGFAIPLLALAATGSPAQAGVIGAVGLAVRAASTVAGGVLADRRDRTTLMVLGGLLGVVLAAGFTVLALGPALGFASLLLFNALMAARNGAFGTATSAALKDAVPASALGRAQAANQGRDAVIALSGGPLGGMLLAVGGWLVGAVMIACQATATIAALILRSVRRAPASTPDATPAAAKPAGAGAAPHPEAGPAPDPAPRRRASARAELREAFTWLWGRPDLRGALLVCTIVNLGFNTVVTTVIYSLQQAGTAPATIGLVSTGIGAGMLLGALAGPALVSRVPAGVLTGVGLCLVTAAALLLPLVHHPGAVGAILALGMAGTPALNAALLGYFMVATPSTLIGRATSILELFATGAMPLAPLSAGLGLALIGREATLLCGAALCAVSAALALATPQLRRLPAEARWSAHAAGISGTMTPPAARP